MIASAGASKDYMFFSYLPSAYPSAPALAILPSSGGPSFSLAGHPPALTSSTGGVNELRLEPGFEPPSTKLARLLPPVTSLPGCELTLRWLARGLEGDAGDLAAFDRGGLAACELERRL